MILWLIACAWSSVLIDYQSSAYNENNNKKMKDE